MHCAGPGRPPGDGYGEALKPSRKQLLVVFLAVAVVPAALAGWLAWRLLAQDRIMAQERLHELLERRADEVVQSVSRALGALAQDSPNLPPGAVRAIGAPLAYAAQPWLLPEAPAHVFSPGERAEFRAAQSEDAIAFYRKSDGIPAGLHPGGRVAAVGAYFPKGRQACGVDAGLPAAFENRRCRSRRCARAFGWPAGHLRDARRSGPHGKVKE